MIKVKYTLEILAIKLLTIIIFLSGCTKLIEIPPPTTSITGETVFENDATASAVLVGIYTQLSQGSFLVGNNSITLYAGLSADEISLLENTPNITYTAHFRNALSNTTAQDFWGELYRYIYKTNDAIIGIMASNNINQNLKRQLIGESKFIRDLCYFNLVNLYGEVPLVTGVDYKENSNVERASIKDVYNFLIKDLTEAKELLSEFYVSYDGVTKTNLRLRPNKFAASALLARIYLYTRDYINAEIESSSIISNQDLYDTASINQVFLNESREAIWALQPVTTGFNNFDGGIFILPDSGPNIYGYSCFLSKFQMNAFESQDLRRKNWTDSIVANNNIYYYPYKYKATANQTNLTEEAVILRLGEQYLIRAEARAQNGDIEGALSDINLIRKRAGLADIQTNDKSVLISAIQHERQVELFIEFGQRWFDLKRTGEINIVMSQVTPQKGGNWSTNWQLYPISSDELSRNPKLFQNIGY